MASSKVRAVKLNPKDGSQASMLFAEDAALFGNAGDIYACEGARLVLDCETTGLEWWRDKFVGVGVYCPDRDRATYIVTQTETERAEVAKAITAIAANPETTLIFHNVKFDAHFLRLRLAEAAATFYDTAVMAHLYDSRLSKKLRDLERNFLGTDTKTETKGGTKGKDIFAMPLPTLATYCINDCRVTMALYDFFTPLMEQLKLRALLKKDMAYAAMLQKVERRGMMIDLEFVERALGRFYHNLTGMEEELYKRSAELAAANGRPRLDKFDWRSPTQLSRALYEGMGIAKPINPYVDENGVDHSRIGGKYNDLNTSSFLLMEKANHPLGALVMDIRETDKLRETLEKWRALADADSLLHTSFNVTGTRTGRLSSSNPNLQNTPGKERVRDTQSAYSGGTIRQDEYNLRAGLVARPGHSFLSIDYKQQEMRLFAILAKEANMIEAIRQRLDIHTEVAKLVWGDEIKKNPELLPIRREWSKTIGFGIVYGMTTGTVEVRLNKTRNEANAIVDTYLARFPRVRPFLKETMKQCERQKMLRYWSGRIWREDVPMMMYKGANALVQGGGADLISIAALRVDKHLGSSLPADCGIISIVHDELLYELPDDVLMDVGREVTKIQEVENLFDVPFVTDAKVGKAYGLMEKVKLD